MNLKSRGRLDEGLYPVKVGDAWEFDKNLIVAETVLLNDGLADTEGVDAVANHFNRVLDGPVVERLFDVRLHRDGHGVIAATAHVVLAGVLAVEK